MTTQKSYYRVRLGEGHTYAKECYEGEFIGVRGSHDDGVGFDLSNDLLGDKRDFNAKFRNIFLEHDPTKTKIAAGGDCGVLWNLCKEIKKEDIVLCPNGQDECWVGEVISDYLFQPKPNSCLPHRRKVKWLPKLLHIQICH